MQNNEKAKEVDDSCFDIGGNFAFDSRILHVLFSFFKSIKDRECKS